MSIGSSKLADRCSSRRGFLKTVGVSGAAISFAGCTGGSGEDTELRLSGCHPEEGTNMGQFQVAFKESVESKTDSLTINNFFEGELGGTVEVIESVAEGNVDMNACHHYPGAASTLGIPELAFFSSPLIFDDYSETLRAINPENTDFAREMHDRHIEEADTRILTSFAFGTRCFSMVDQRVTTPEEVGGARIRGPDGDLMTAVIEGLGGEPVLIDWQETPQALATGQADGIEQILWALELEPIIENTDYMIRTNHMPEAIGLTINEDTFQDLSDEQQDVLLEAAEETRESELEAALERDQGRVDNIEEAGVEIVDEDSGLDLEAFRESVFASVEESFPEWEEVREELTAAL